MSKGKIETIVRGVWIEDGKLLVCRNRKCGHCFLPGGHVEFGEAAAAALVREMQEETGLSMAVGRFLGATEGAFDQLHDDGQTVRRHEINLVFELVGRDIDPQSVSSREEHIGFEWHDLKKIGREDATVKLLPQGVLALLPTSGGDAAWVSEGM